MALVSSRRRGGAIARHAGASFEGWLEVHHREAVRVGLLAWWRHVSPRVMWIGHGAKAQAKVVGEACADYVGQLATTGRALVVEAKSTSHARFALAQLEVQQLAHLDACAAGGGLAILAIEFREQGEGTLRILGRYAVPWQSVPWQVLRSARSVGPAELAPWLVRGPCYLEPLVAAGAR